MDEIERPTDASDTLQLTEATARGTLVSSKTSIIKNHHITQAIIRDNSDGNLVLCIWNDHAFKSDLILNKEYAVSGPVRMRNGRLCMVQPGINPITTTTRD